MLSFKANLVKYSMVDYLTSDGKLKNKKVSVVELNPESAEDIVALEKVNETWQTEHAIPQDILSDLYNYNDTLHQFEKRTFYAVTSQKTCFDCLDYKKILGIAEFTDKLFLNSYLDFIQVRPDVINNDDKLKSGYRHIGKTLIDTIKQFSIHKKIYLNAVPNAIEFYKKQGFTVVQSDIQEPLMKYVKWC